MQTELDLALLFAPKKSRRKIHLRCLNGLYAYDLKCESKPESFNDVFIFLQFTLQIALPANFHFLYPCTRFTPFFPIFYFIIYNTKYYRYRIQAIKQTFERTRRISM